MNFPLLKARENDRRIRWAELVAVFGALPPVLGFLCPPPTWIPVLWGLAIFAAWRLRRAAPESQAGTPVVTYRAEIRRILWRFAFVSVFMLVAVWVWRPALLFAWPRQRPLLWLAVMVLYPLWSVYPQELLFRQWFFKRYALLFGDYKWLVLTSAVFFGWAHVVMQNGLAIGLSLAAGCLFAQTYRRTRSLALVCLEHALYGDLVFTIGLGSFFFHGAVK